MINIQPIEKRSLGDGLTLSVHSIFHTIQGEGPYSGYAAVFIRLAGCNLQCPMCDTDYTSDRNIRPISNIVSTVCNLCPPKPIFYASRRKPLVVITGGEPFRQKMGPLINALLKFGYGVQIETNGTLFDPDLPYTDIDIVCSPKAGVVNPQLVPHISAYKYVLHADQVDPDDGLPTLALNHTASPRVARPPVDFDGLVYVQPVDEGNESLNYSHLQAAIVSTMKYGYILCLQTHKLIGMA
jgi:7-carboxy-7-deazaguanine synthase